MGYTELINRLKEKDQKGRDSPGLPDFSFGRNRDGDSAGENAQTGGAVDGAHRA